MKMNTCLRRTILYLVAKMTSVAVVGTSASYERDRGRNADAG